MLAFSRITLILLNLKINLKKNYSFFLRPTISKGEAVHDGHPIEPVLIAGVPHGEDARPITQQRALQPAGNIPCNRRGFVFFLVVVVPVGLSADR